MNTSNDSENLEPEQTQNSQSNSPEKFTVSDQICWSPRYEFDAPRYTNFGSNKYRETRRILNKLILGETEANPEEQKSVEDKMEVDVEMNHMLDSDDELSELSLTRSPSSSSDSGIDEWFDRFHPLHEPLRPMTPPGPQISPERRGNLRSFIGLNASPLKLDTDGLSSSFTQSPNASVNTPSKGPNTRIGLRSKPARVLKSSNGPASSSASPTKSFMNSSPSSLMRGANFFHELENRSSAKSPIRSSAMSPVRKSLTSVRNSTISGAVSNTTSPVRNSFIRNAAISPIRASNMSPTQSPVKSRINAMSPVRNTANISPVRNQPQTSPSLLLSSTSSVISLSGLARDILISPVKNAPTSPLKMKSKYSEGTASPLRNSIGVLQLQAETIVTKKRPADPVPDVPNVPKESVSHVPNVSNAAGANTASAKIRKHPKIDAELEDIKKLLSQHNSRIRPNKKTT